MHLSHGNGAQVNTIATLNLKDNIHSLDQVAMQISPFDRAKIQDPLLVPTKVAMLI